MAASLEKSFRVRFYSVPLSPVGDHQAAGLSSLTVALATNAPTTLRAIYCRQEKPSGLGTRTTGESLHMSSSP